MAGDPFGVVRFDHVVINARDVDVTAEWYVRVLGMRRETYRDDDVERTALLFGDQKFNVRPTGAPGWETARVDAPGSLDLCLIADVEPDRIAEHLRAVDVPVHLGPVTRTGALGEMTSYYVVDPDGSAIEIASYHR